MLRKHEKENRSNTTFWNRLIPCRWEETLWGQQYLSATGWWKRVYQFEIELRNASVASIPAISVRTEELYLPNAKRVNSLSEVVDGGYGIYILEGWNLYRHDIDDLRKRVAGF